MKTGRYVSILMPGPILATLPLGCHERIWVQILAIS